MRKTKTEKKQTPPIPVTEVPQSELFKILMSDEHSLRLKALVQKINARNQSQTEDSTVISQPKRKERAG